MTSNSLIGLLEGLVTPMTTEIERNLMRKVISVVKDYQTNKTIESKSP